MATYLTNTENPAEVNINERVHWSVIAKRDAGGTATYAPPNLPANITAAQIANIHRKSACFSVLGKGSVRRPCIPFVLARGADFRNAAIRSLSE